MSLSEVPGWLLLLAYVSVAIEMLVFAVPSEASTLQLMTRDAQPGEGRLAAARKQSSLTKFLRFWLSSTAYAPTRIASTFSMRVEDRMRQICFGAHKDNFWEISPKEMSQYCLWGGR